MDCGATGNGPKEPANTAELRVRIILQSPQPVPAENALNEVDPRDPAYWLQRGKRRCKVSNNPGREVVVADRQVSVNSFLVTLRYDSLTKLIDGAWRFVLPRPGMPPAVWNVESATNWNERNRWIMVRCTGQV